MIPALVWLAAMATSTLLTPGVTEGFRAHIFFGLAVFCIVILVPLAVTALTLHWVARRIAAAIVVLSFFGMLRGALAQGFGVLPDIGITLALALVFGSILALLSRTPLLVAVGDGYRFLSVRDVFSRYTFRRQPPPLAAPHTIA